MKSKKLRAITTAAFAVVAAIVLLRAFAQARKDPPDQDDKEEQQEAIKTPSRVSVQNGKVLIKLSPAAQSLAGIDVAPLESARMRKEITAPAAVLPIQDLVNFSASYAASQANLHKAENNLSVSRLEYDRLKTLFANHQNASAKALEAAAGTFHNDQTDVAVAQRNLELEIATVRQSWGNVVARWVSGDPRTLQTFFSRQEVLLQITLPAGEPAAAPSMISLDLPSGGRSPANLVSPFPRVDPRIQGVNFLYETPGRSELAPGLNLIAHLTFGPRLQGEVIPSAAVVWWQGKAWVYEQTAANEFAREPLPADNAVPGGFFVSKGFSPGEKIVLSSAQALLSEEFRSQIQPEE